MKLRSLFALTTVLLAALLALPLSSTAQGPAGQASAGLAARRAQLRALVAGALAEGRPVTLPKALAEARGPVNVIVKLADPPAARVYARGKAAGLAEADAVGAAEAQAARIDRAQDRFLGAARALGAQAFFRYNRVYNGVSLRLDASRLPDLARVSGVTAIHPDRVVFREHTSSVPLVGAPSVWEGASGVTGDGVSIAVMDTGIDYYHVGFGGEGLDAYNADDPRVVEPGSFPTTKVITGTDLVGEVYDSADPTTLQPDPDPLDGPYFACDGVGHGTHVAGTAAGQGVTAAGATYTGPYSSAIDFDDFRVGPGVAPEANLIAVKVFGCDTGGTATSVLVAGVEYSVEAGADVINTSIGYNYGTYVEDPWSEAVDAATAAGVVYVGSAGNDSDTYYITGGASAADTAISVASSQDRRSVVDAFRVNSPDSIDGLKKATFSVAYNWRAGAPVTGDLVYVTTNANTRTGCSPSAGVNPFAPGSLAGQVVLLDWAPQGSSDFACGSVARSTNATAAGAIGIIMVSGQTFFDASITGSDSVPAVFTTYDVGQELKTALGGGAVSVTFSEEFRNSVRLDEPELEDAISDFSSRGPRSHDGALKPDLTGPGDTIFSVGAGTGNEGQTLGGTSMAAPHVAGTIALLKELHPTWTPQELKALVMNSATNDIYSQFDQQRPIYGPGRTGSGRLNVPSAATLTTIAYDSARPELVSVSFGAVEVLTDTVVTRAVTLENKGAAAASYSLSYAPGASIPGVSYSFTPTSISVPANGTATVSVTMEADFEAMRHTFDPALTPEQDGLPRHWLSEAAGNLALYASAPTEFAAVLSGLSEVPPNSSSKTGEVSFTYNAGTNTLSYSVVFGEDITIAGPGSHLHRGPAGKNGPIAVNLLANGAYTAGQTYSGDVVLTDADEALLYQGGLYANFHTAAFPGGEIRGQVAATSAPAGRLAIHAAARPASAMASAPDTLGFINAITGTASLSLSGSELNTGSGLPIDIVSVVTAFELQHTSPNASSGIAAQSDLAAVGVTSDFGGGTSVLSSTLYFGVASHADWSSPNLVEFDLYIDTDGSGVADTGEGAEYVLFNWNVGSAAGGEHTDVFVTILVNLETDELSLIDFVNAVPADFTDTAPFNSNVMVLPVPAADLGLTAAASRINYRVFSFNYYLDGQIDQTGQLTYDLARPGVDFGPSANLVAGPAYADINGGSIPVSYTRANYEANRSRGILLLHHHNASGNRVETVLVAPRLYMPFLAKR